MNQEFITTNGNLVSLKKTFTCPFHKTIKQVSSISKEGEFHAILEMFELRLHFSGRYAPRRFNMSQLQRKMYIQECHVLFRRVWHDSRAPRGRAHRSEIIITFFFCNLLPSAILCQNSTLEKAKIFQAALIVIELKSKSLKHKAVLYCHTFPGPVA